MNLPKVIYWLSTVLLCLLLTYTAAMYVFRHEDVKIAMELLEYPTYIIYPLAVAKVLAVIAILSNKSRFLKQLAYAGIFYNFTLAFAAHAVKVDGAGILAFLGLVLLFLSFTMDKVLYPKKKVAYDL